MSNPDPLRFAIAGCGNMGGRHAEILAATPGAVVTALWDRDPAAAQAAADKLGTPEAVHSGDYAGLLARADIDAVVLALPSGLHAAHGIDAARAGKHVVTEKPIDIDPAAGSALAAACADAGRLCAVISQNRFSDGNAALAAALRRGELGAPALIEASVRWFRHDPYYTGSDWRGRLQGEGGGVIMNQAIHTIDLLLWMFGEPETVTGLTHNTRPAVLETEDTAVAVMRFPGGALCTLTASTAAFPGFEEGIAVYGPRAHAKVESGALTAWRHADDAPRPEPPPFEPATPGLSPKFTLFQRQYRNILAAAAGREPLLVTPAESLATLRTALAVYGR